MALPTNSVTTASTVSNSRGCSLMQVLVNIQQGVQQAPPVSSPVYLGDTESVAPTKTDASSVAAVGPPYYCVTSAVTVGTANTIMAGFFTAS
jgi:hypothetical protein